MSNSETAPSWDQLLEHIENEDAERLRLLLETLSSSETARAISRLNHENQTELLMLLSPKDAASVIEDVEEVHAIELIEEMPPDRAAAIVKEMESDGRADLLGGLNESGAGSDSGGDARNRCPGDSQTLGLLSEFRGWFDEYRSHLLSGHSECRGISGIICHSTARSIRTTTSNMFL